MKRAFVQCAEVVLETGADRAAPGGAVTLALCGSWDHAGACRWPHHTSATWDELRGHVRVVFAADEDEEMKVRALIDAALLGGECVGPDAKVSHWETTECRAGTLRESEETLAGRLMQAG
jgi:hypothetical protein